VNRHDGHGGQDVPLLHGTITIRSPRSVVLLQPFQLSLVLALWIVSVIFTVWPQALEHSAISFEQRGIVHHVWHYTLLAASATTLVGMFSAGRRRLQVELIGLCLLVGALGMNLTATVADALSTPTEDASLSGIGVATRVAAILGLALRAVIVATEPTVELHRDDVTAE
jgi:membrane-associated HD superfamily phosphohydrolase